MQPVLEFEPTPAANSLIPASTGTDYEAIAYFPWKLEDSSKLNWDGFIWSDERRARWKSIVQRWTGVAAICGRNHDENKILFVRTTPEQPLRILGRVAIDVKGEGFRAMCWSLHYKTLAPLLVFGGLTSNLYAYDVESRLITSVLRGHGGRITSLHAQPQNPQIIVSTSRDRTARIWRMNLSPETTIEHSDPSRARLGPPFGAPLTNGEAEATGMGRCVLVTEGGMPSDGHKATVLDADFHPTLNLLATSSEDHAVMIWHYKPLNISANGTITHTNLTRPVFASTHLHHAAVICIHWLSPTILISQSTRSVSDKERTFPDKLVVWKWIQRADAALTTGLEYVQSGLDYSESDSYKILAEIPIAQDAAKLSFTEKLVILTTNSMIRIIDPSQLRPRPAPQPLMFIDLRYDDDPAWHRTLDSQKKKMNEQAQNTQFPGVVATIQLNDEPYREQDDTYSAALFHGLLLRVGTNERLIVWKAKGL